MSEILKIDNLSKDFGGKAVLRDLSLTVDKGSVYGLLGRNGEGKTTLIRILLGIIPADSGTILFQNRAVRYSDSGYKRTIGYIPEDPFFYDWMTVGGLLDFNSRFYSRWSRDKADGYVRSFSLDRRQKIRALSRGQKLKLELVAALAAEPELLVLDDPTSGLDVPTRQDFLRDVIRELAAAGTTVLFATHLVHELERIVERLGILHGGRLIVEDSFEKIQELTRRVSLSFEGPPSGPLRVPGTIFEQGDGRHVATVVYPWGPEPEATIDRLKPVRKDVQPMSLEDIFVSFVSRGQ